MMASERREKSTTFNNRISAKQLHNVVHSKVRIQNEKAKLQDSIRLERDQFEKRMNQDAKAFLRKVKVPIAGSLNTRKTTTNDIKLPEIIESGSKSTPSSPSLGRPKPSSYDNSTRAQSPSVLLLPSGPRRGSVNNIADSLAVPLSPLVNRRGSFPEISSPFQSPLSSPLLERRRMTVGVIPSAKQGPTTKYLAIRQLQRIDSIISSTSPPPSPVHSTLEDQFKALESCRYLRRGSSWEDDDADQVDKSSSTKPDGPC